MLESKDHRLTCLNFDFCYIQPSELSMLCRSLQINRTLIKLNLSNNGFPNASGIMLCEVLKVRSPLTQNNVTLVDLNLSKNSLGDLFASALAKALETNNTVMVVDISSNLIETSGAACLIQCLTETNDTL